MIGETERSHDKVRLKNLIIISGNTVPENKNLDFISSDILAISLPTMANLDNKNIKFKTLEDYHPHKACYKDTEDFAAAHREWLEVCDSICHNKIDVNRGFSSNGFWFLHRLSDLRYIHCILDKVTEKYERIDMVTQTEVGDLPTPIVDFTTLSLPMFGVGLEHVLMFIKAGLPELTIHCSNRKTKLTPNILGGPVSHFLKRFPEIIARRSRNLLNDFITLTKRKNEMYWVVQGGYDVEVLRKKWKNRKFNYIWQDELKAADECTKANNDELLNEVIIESELFFRRWLPRYSEWLISLVKNYTEEIALRIPSVECEVLSRMESQKPKAIMYAIGIENVLEEAIARVANKISVPVYTFKHGGVENQFLLPSILDSYLEKNPAVKRVQFLHNEYEKRDIEDISLVNAFVVGVLDKPELPDSNKSTNKILFSAGVPAHFSFKEMRKMCSDFERYSFSKTLLESCAKMQIPLDIKIHPLEWSIGYDFFCSLVDCDATYSNTNILAGGSIERILCNYGLLVLDMLGTRVFSRALYLDIPIILFIPKDFPVNPKYINDLKQRVYIVDDKDELDCILVRYKNGKLENRYNDGFQKKYLSIDSNETEIDKVIKIISQA